jgi:hypothetical protein
MIGEYGNAEDFISNNGIEVARLVADNCIQYTPEKNPDIKNIYQI